MINDSYIRWIDRQIDLQINNGLVDLQMDIWIDRQKDRTI